MEKVLIVLRGLPSSGKSTVAELLSEGRYTICTADDFFIGKDGEYNFNPTKLGLAHKACQKKAELAMAAGEDKIFIANTNTTESEMNPYFAMAVQYGYKVVSLIVEKRHGNVNNHNVPEESLKKMETRFSIKLR